MPLALFVNPLEFLHPLFILLQGRFQFVDLLARAGDVPTSLLLGPESLEELPDRGDTYGMNTDLFSPDSDFITYHTVVSTSADQIAIAPGYLKRSWEEDDRRYFEYDMGETRILDFSRTFRGATR